METNKFSKKVVSSFIIGGLLLSLGGIAMAGTTEDAVNSASKTVKAGFAKFHGNKGNGIGRGAKDPATMQADLKTKLGTLVTAGTITQAKVDAIIAALAKNQEVRKTEMEKMQAMTPAERQTNKQIANKERVNPISQLVTKGVITQTEADAIAKILPQRGFSQDGRGGRKGPGMERGAGDPAKMQTGLKANLAKLVTAGTITQAQADKIVATCAQEQVTKAAEFAKVKAMTEAERQLYFQANKGKEKRVNPWSQLVTDQTLTQAQADAINKAMFRRGPGQGGMDGKGFRGGRHTNPTATATK